MDVYFVCCQTVCLIFIQCHFTTVKVADVTQLSYYSSVLSKGYHVGFVVGTVTLREIFSPSVSVFSSRYNFHCCSVFTHVHCPT